MNAPNPTMNIDAAQLVQDLQRPELDREQVVQSLQELSFSDFHAILIHALTIVDATDESSEHGWLSTVCRSLSQRISTWSQQQSQAIEQSSEAADKDENFSATPTQSTGLQPILDETFTSIAETIAKLYSGLGAHHTFRYQLLTCLAQLGTAQTLCAALCANNQADQNQTDQVHGNKTNSDPGDPVGGTGSATPLNGLQLLADKMVDDPPQGIGPAAAPLVHLCRPQSAEAIAALYPRMLDALANPDVAPAILDLANFFTRTGQTAEHPAAERIDGLLSIAEAIVAQLEPLQDGSVPDAEELLRRQERVARTLPLAVSLCDALGMIRDDRAMPTLERIGELKHRRLRVESAAARVRLSQQSSHEIDATKAEWLEKAVTDLVELASESSVRTRVIAYAEELEVADRVPEEFDTPVARAEGELVTFLIQPTQMGLPPERCELVDTKTLYWPSYEEPRNCYLFRFEYSVRPSAEAEEASTYANLAIVGPAVHAFHADLTDLPTEEVYAAFAGWQAEHEDIRHKEIDAGADVALLPAAVRELLSRVSDDYTNVQPRIFGMFFDQPVIVAVAQRGTAFGALVIDDQMHEPNWYPVISERSIGPGEAWLIYKGKRLLDSFNDDWTVE